MPETTELPIRWLIRRDMPQILEIENASFARPWSEDDFVQFLRHRSSIGLVAERGEQIIGFVVYELKKHCLEIANMAVAPDHRRTGIGTAMVQKLTRKLATNPVRKRLDVYVRESSLDTQLFFKANGFRCINIDRSHYSDTDEGGYLMQYCAVPELASQGSNRISAY